ncbi:acyltransferase family protein [Bradyrhizobium glycinis]|uniref:acyltransferase family protein n=1 Tax=Bradyrhizobium glycinis TaxID=2751812 RepID=UPI0018D84E6E|nr:acyltransferase [Bradyrhizobium glycinis]MBH5368993.1 acyltransferase [Bradyrhizobium glycinis]
MKSEQDDDCLSMDTTRSISERRSKLVIQQPAIRGAKIGVVNGLRGIAILMVVLHHLFIPYAGRNPLHAGELAADGIFTSFITYAWLGVPIFFVLSGFVLYLPYRMGRRTISGPPDFWAFYLHRASRLLPLYYIVVLVSLTLHAQTAIGSRNWYLEAGGLLSTLFVFSPHGFMPPSNMVLWSVGVEIWFSLLFPLLILAIRRWGIVAVAVAAVAVCAVFNCVGGSIPIVNVGAFRPFTNGIFGTCYQFVLGMLICDTYVRILGKGNRPSFHLVALLSGLLGMLLAVYLMHNSPWLFGRVVGNVLFSAAFSLVLLGSLFAGKVVRWLLENWPLQLLGCMCYSLYAWHGIVMGEMIPSATSMLVDTMRQLVPFTIVILALSALSYRYIEFGHVREWKALFLIEPGSTLRRRMLPQSIVIAHSSDQPVSATNARFQSSSPTGKASSQVFPSSSLADQQEGT